MKREKYYNRKINTYATVIGNGGGSITTPLLVVFVVLKLTDVINWSWWLVLSPLWGVVALLLLLAFLHIIITIIIKK